MSNQTSYPPDDFVVAADDDDERGGDIVLPSISVSVPLPDRRCRWCTVCVGATHVFAADSPRGFVGGAARVGKASWAEELTKQQQHGHER